MIRKFLIMLLMFSSSFAMAQELSVTVNINSSKIPGSDKTIYTEMQKAFLEFFNNTKWSSDKFHNEERIECSIMIIIDGRPSNDEFQGSIQVQSSRPVFKASYSTPLVNIKDEKFWFKYIQYQQLEYNSSGTNTNLVNVLAYYANIILGFDYDSYSSLGGNSFFNKAQQIVAQNSSASEPGWKSYESTRNRYWLTENLMNPIFRPLRILNYQMHRKGLDMMFDKRDDGLRNIAEALDPLPEVFNQKPGSYLFTVFFTAKSDELVNIFSGDVVPPDIKNKAKQVLLQIDPGNSTKYNGITGG